MLVALPESSCSRHTKPGLCSAMALMRSRLLRKSSMIGSSIGARRRPTLNCASCTSALCRAAARSRRDAVRVRSRSFDTHARAGQGGRPQGSEASMARPTTPVEIAARRWMGAMQRTVDLELGLARFGIRAADRVMAAAAGVLGRVTDSVEAGRRVDDGLTEAGRPVLAVDELAGRDEWDAGRSALGGFLADRGVDAERIPAGPSEP